MSEKKNAQEWLAEIKAHPDKYNIDTAHIKRVEKLVEDADAEFKRTEARQKKRKEQEARETAEELVKLFTEAKTDE